jgi:hypothetical protein
MDFGIKGFRVFLFEFVTWIHPPVPVNVHKSGERSSAVGVSDALSKNPALRISEVALFGRITRPHPTLSRHGLRSMW